jgi:hypothetical protein
MKIKRNLLLFSYCIAALVLVAMDSVIQEVNFNVVSLELKITYSVILITAFIYLHYGYQSYLIPKTVITKGESGNVKVCNKNYCRKSFFKGAIGLGYLCILRSVGSIFSSPPDVKSYVMAGVIFVVLGLAAKARGTYIHCASISHTRKTHNN